MRLQAHVISRLGIGGRQRSCVDNQRRRVGRIRGRWGGLLPATRARLCSSLRPGGSERNGQQQGECQRSDKVQPAVVRKSTSSKIVMICQFQPSDSQNQLWMQPKALGFAPIMLALKRESAKFAASSAGNYRLRRMKERRIFRGMRYLFLWFGFDGIELSSC